MNASELSVEHLVAQQQRFFRSLRHQAEAQKILLGKTCVNQLKEFRSMQNWCNCEFQVFSQWGDDGLIQYLLYKLPIVPHTFIEFGVQNYDESNTRFLLINDNWSGCIFDCDSSNIEYVKKQDYYWRYDLTAKAEFITRDNINLLLKENGFIDKVGIMSIDVDGNDYWIWQAIDVVEPQIVIVEYNASFGSNAAITIPYQESFQRTEAHFSNLYWGASLSALVQLSEQKGYFFVGCNSNGNNAYFVHKRYADLIEKKDSQEDFVAAKFRESRDEDGKLTYLSQKEITLAIGHLPVFDIDKGREYSLFEARK